MQIEAIQDALREQGLDAWLFYDHHHRDPIAYSILGLPASAHVTRRWYYAIPAAGEPRKLVHRIESGRLDSLPGSKGVNPGAPIRCGAPACAVRPRRGSHNTSAA